MSGEGKQRPIGIPAFEDKVLQRAVAMVMEAICEQDFYDCSYGFRPGRSAHQALDAVWRELGATRGGWVVELDIEAFFDTLEHQHLRAFVRQRVCDGVICKLIDKWLKAGVMEDGQLIYRDEGRARRRAASSRRSWRTSTCTMCWIAGLKRKCARGCADAAR